MSVLNQSGEEQVECPLCMEPLEVDDLNFYPCTCGYQICRFCWHRIRVDENGLCPACRKAYSENPADFTPLSQQQVLQLKAEKRARDQQRKAKLSESRKHLAAVRVVQKNLVFVVGLPVRLADAEVLKRNEYFGKFGKIHKVVINQSTSYAGSQGPSASAYVTYVKSDDALRAIQSVNNITLDGRLIKSSLGTTKYCSHFMKNQPCPKADCMYLHDFGDPEASFTKEQMHVGKHQEYEKKLHDSLQSRTQQQQQQQQSNQSNSIQQQQPGTGNSKGDSTTNTGQTGSLSQIATGNGDKPESKERETRERDQREKGDKKNWPTLSGDSSGGFPAKTEKPSTATKPSKKPSKPKPSPPINSSTSVSTQNSLPNSNSLKIDQNIQNSRAKQQCESNSSISGQSTITSCPLQHSPTIEIQQQTSQSTILTSETLENLQKLQILDDNSSFFSNNSFQKCLPEVGDQLPGRNTPEVTRSHILNDNLPDITSSEDWQAAFGFKNDKNLQQNLENSINGLTTPINGLNGHITQNLDQQMSKFFAEFNKNNFNLQNGFQNQENQLLLMNYQRLENEMMYNLKHNVYQQQNQQPTNNQYLQQNGHSYQNGLNTEYMNGFNGFQQHQQQNSVFQNQPLTQQRNLQGLRGDRNSVDDDLGFDPFHETQKALAELIESEQSVQQIQNNGVLGSSSSAPSSSDRGPTNSGAPNGLLGGSGAHLPPPPGFVQHNTHMNSFGSKILPFLNMSNNQQISNTNGWSTNNYNEAQIKGVAPVSDWMTLDPAIVSSSRHFPLSHFPLFPHHAHSHSHAHTHSHNPPMGVQQNHHTSHQNQSIFDVRQNSSQGFDVRQQPMFGVGMNGAVVGGSNNGVGVTNLGNINGGVNNLQNLQNLQNLGWFSEFQAVNSPPGFRNKGQEC